MSSNKDFYIDEVVHKYTIKFVGHVPEQDLSNIAIKPCPFCGGRNFIVMFYSRSKVHRVRCCNCNYSVEINLPSSCVGMEYFCVDVWNKISAEMKAKSNA